MGIVENAKEAVKLVQQIDNVELYRKILDLQSEAMDLTEQLQQRDEKIRFLEEALRLKGKMIPIRSAYYLTDDAGEIVDGPFCTKCFDVDHVQCRLVRTGNYYHELVHCLKCKIEFHSSEACEFLKGNAGPAKKLAKK
ncbi:MAG: hypothetical protein ISS79_01665 [Phycisphaerae bacterium]|nr:hypothetical protein [Phycisphaerae bacterium]